MEEVAKAVGGGYCRLQMPLKPALAVRDTGAGRRLGALLGAGGGTPPPLPMHPWAGMWARQGRCRRHCILGVPQHQQLQPFCAGSSSAPQVHIVQVSVALCMGMHVGGVREAVGALVVSRRAKFPCPAKFCPAKSPYNPPPPPRAVMLKCSTIGWSEATAPQNDAAQHPFNSESRPLVRVLCQRKHRRNRFPQMSTIVAPFVSY